MHILPLEVICENILPYLSVRELQALDTAFTNKLHRPKLREVWKSYRWLRMNFVIEFHELRWIGSAGMQVIGAWTWRNTPSEDVLFFASVNCPMLKQLYHDSYCIITDEMLIKLAHGCPHLEMLHLSDGDYSDIGVIALAQNCRQLHTISLHSRKITDTAIQALCDNCPHLLNIDISRCRKLANASLMAIANSYPHLQSIDMRNYFVTDDVLIFFANRCHELRSVSVGHAEYNFNITCSGLSALWAANPNLTDVIIDRNIAIFDDHIILLLKNCRYLKNISLIWRDKISDAAVIAVAEHCPQLTSLNIYGCSNVSDVSLIALGQHCHELKSIDISFLRKITDVGISALAAGCPLLEKFSAEHTYISDISIITLAAGCHELCKVNLGFCRSIGAPGICAIAEKCPLISELDISSCYNMNDACLDAIAQHCRNITKLRIRALRKFSMKSFVTVLESCRQLRGVSCEEPYASRMFKIQR